ncbi:MAG: M3 family metallopeptidase, partial [Myxococcota bacterium]|nr:M3 family metallopeptidase [Myxococcota bacterium]
KRGGAFCSPGTPPDHPWVMVNFAGRTENVFTLAHELGHGLHFQLALEQSPLNYHCGLPLAETASVFAELWLHELLMEQASTDQERVRLLTRQVQSAFGTAFHQVAYVNWELRAHRARAEGVVSPEQLCSMWAEEMQRCWGPEVAMSEGDRWRWITIPHFIFARFYCYSYAFGKLLTLSLHRLWRDRGEDFVQDYIALLSAGGAKAPVDLFAAIGLDLSDPAFWQGGLDVVAGYMDELDELA